MRWFSALPLKLPRVTKFAFKKKNQTLLDSLMNACGLMTSFFDIGVNVGV